MAALADRGSAGGDEVRWTLEDVVIEPSSPLFIAIFTCIVVLVLIDWVRRQQD